MSVIFFQYEKRAHACFGKKLIYDVWLISTAKKSSGSWRKKNRIRKKKKRQFSEIQNVNQTVAFFFLFDIKAKISCGFVNWRPGSVCFGVRSRSASSIAATKRFTLFGLDTTKLWVILEVAILTPPLFWLFCVFIVYAMCDKNTISKTKIISK